ncbi:hypothetical protein VCRA2113O415_140008 [Vibrio crassostreae]|nr:hypothetical protein VCRA2113O415_140008 [Vibrio crassostreae]CAK2574227.1 hypothetical protein VCRA2113O420_150114 [Vibrio crassostreae]CAK3170694.1 hypothetical protein VCRA2121O436_150008 [Vibrio crassostreae]
MIYFHPLNHLLKLSKMQMFTLALSLIITSGKDLITGSKMRVSLPYYHCRC